VTGPVQAGGIPLKSVYVNESVYVVDGESVGMGTATYGMFPLIVAGVANGVGSGDGGDVYAPTGTLEPEDDCMFTLPVP
jgi:hypothetical protein